MTDASDIPIDHWVNRHLPENWRPYARLMRLDRPIGSWLLLLPCWWGLALGWRAGPEATDIWEIARLYLLFSVGAVVMRGAGCAVNDLWDRDFDAKVARTINRPIAYGDLSVKQALGFLVVLLLIGLAILLQLNQASWILGVSVLVLVFTYPLFKRVTYWPQFVLGLTFNWGALMGWVFIPSVPSEKKLSFDWTGYILLIVSVYCLVTGLTEGNREGWSSTYIIAMM